jgi:hypothetical protein
MAADDVGPRRNVDPLEVLNPERLLDYADWCRRMARFWTDLADERMPERASRLRCTASAALYAAWRADELLKLCDELATQRRRAASRDGHGVPQEALTDVSPGLAFRSSHTHRR